MPEASAPVTYGLSARVARVTLNRPQHRNALSADVMDGLLAALARASTDDEAHVIVLTGAGDKAFCAGGDLTSLARMGTADEAGGPVEDSAPFRLFSAFRQLGKPVIARLAGHALGGGLGLAASCDIAIAADDVKVGTPEINVGLWPMMIMSVLNRHIGPKQAFMLYYTGQLVSAPDAVRMGLLSEAVPRGDLDRRVDELAGVIAGKSPGALRLGRAAFFETEGQPFAEQLRHLLGQLATLAATHDAREGITAFLQKRPPKFTGT